MKVLTDIIDEGLNKQTKTKDYGTKHLKDNGFVYYKGEEHVLIHEVTECDLYIWQHQNKKN